MGETYSDGTDLYHCGGERADSAGRSGNADLTDPAASAHQSAPYPRHGSWTPRRAQTPLLQNIIIGPSAGSIPPFIPVPRSVSFFIPTWVRRWREGSAPLIKVGPLRAVTQPVRGSAPNLLMGMLGPGRRPLWVHVGGGFCSRRSKTFSPSSGSL